jgi:23S rRNA (cytosine1962-C5)-methyltransferase
MTEASVIQLQKGREESIIRRHHWIFSGALSNPPSHIKSGELVDILDYKGVFIARGFYAPGSIAVRIVSFENQPINQTFWNERVRKAFELREKLGLTNSLSTTAYRLIFGEGDEIPGLIIDYYNDNIVIQSHHDGILSQLKYISQAVDNQYNGKIKTIFHRSSENKGSAISPANYIKGSNKETEVKENNHPFIVNWIDGQKTGFFIDQRENRSLLTNYVENKSVLNLFSYSATFSVYALKAGASKVDSVDSSPVALQYAKRNYELNSIDCTLHRLICADAISYLSDTDEKYDVMIVDPPAFAKHISSRHQAVQAYKRLNTNAIKKVNQGGFIFTFSCSQVVDRKLFESTIVAAAIEAGRKVKIISRMHQSSDHPNNIFHPETDYLKGLLLFVE